MGYRQMNEQKLYSIYRRRRAGMSISEISKQEGADRKTISDYLHRLAGAGMGLDGPPPSREAFHEACEGLLRVRKKSRPIFEELEPYEEELYVLLRQPMKAKTAFRVIRDKHELNVSYETFKRFCRERDLNRTEKRNIIRIELPPGRETQMDYGSMGLLPVKGMKRGRKVHAFIGTLAHSRLPFVQFTHTQNQQSFTGSFVDMFEFHGGVTEYISIDNLKQGVIKPDLFDPEINRSLQELAEHHDTFINPCRVRQPTDKAKVERMVPIVREQYRYLRNRYPDADLNELNRLVLKWCYEEYGEAIHGTTKVKPAVAFREREKSALKPLPPARFEVQLWKPARVGDDQFITFEKKMYSLPPGHERKQVMVKKLGQMVHIYGGTRKLIRSHAIPSGYRAYMESDFPNTLVGMMDGEHPKYLLERSERYGKAARSFIEEILKPHAYLNARRARGMLDVMAKYENESFFERACNEARRRAITRPSLFKQMIEEELKQLERDTPPPLSELAMHMTRDMNYYFN